MVDALPSFTNINTIIIKASGSENVLSRCIEATTQKLKDLAPSKERRYIRVWHNSNDRAFYLGNHKFIDKGDINAYVRGYYSEVFI
jgi:hypothetical protein